MATPTKRRKTNNFKASPQTGRSLDFFFGKQKQVASSNARDEDSRNSETLPTTSSTLWNDHSDVGCSAQTLTDEDLARKLQSEWDQEAGLKNDAGPDRPSPTRENIVERPQDGAFGDEFRFQHKIQEFDETNAESGSKASEINTLSLQSAVETGDTISSTIPFDESPLTFDPSKYLPNLKDCWAKEGGDASYGLITRCFILVNSTQSRIKIVDTLVNFVRTIIEGDPESLLPAVSGSMKFYLRRSVDLNIGLACYEFDLTALHIIGARFGWVGNIESFEENVWLG